MKNYLNIDQGLLEQFYNLDNYKVIDVETQNTAKKAILYCTSNALYRTKYYTHPKTLIEEHNKFEWTQSMFKGYDRHIFIRDVFQLWYKSGINNRINSIPALIDLIRELTTGYELTCIGISAGGYIAMLIGAVLNADKVFSLSGQIDILDFVNFYGKPEDESSFPDLSGFSSEYLNIQDIVSASKTEIFYFGSIDFVQDHGNLKLAANNPNIKLFVMNNDKHPMPIERYIIKYLINSDKQKLRKLHLKFQGQLIERVTFSKSLLSYSYYYHKLGYKLQRLFKKIARKIGKISQEQQINTGYQNTAS